MEGDVERISIITGVISNLAVAAFTPDTDGVDLTGEVMVVIISPVVVALDSALGASEVLSAAGWRCAADTAVRTTVLW